MKISNYNKYVLSVIFLIILGIITFTGSGEPLGEKHESKGSRRAYHANLASYRYVCNRIFRGRRAEQRDCVYSFTKYAYINYRRIASIKPSNNIGEVNEQEKYRPFFIIKENWSRNRRRNCVTRNVHFLDIRSRPERLPAIRFRQCFRRTNGSMGTRRII